MNVLFLVGGCIRYQSTEEDETQSDLQENALRRYGNDENDLLQPLT